tara:strand:+ start:98 stop:589 length:492 start_codon:yes stop_codon:yes gene_type:complete
MFASYQLQQLRSSDLSSVREVYLDAIQSQGEPLYTQEQIQAWTALACLPGVLDRPLLEGRGWISLENQLVVAFAVRYPLDRLALLYCRGRFSRRGHASLLLDQVEQEAFAEGQKRLVTEASLLSHPFLLRRGWECITSEKIEIGGISFERYIMEKLLFNSLSI